MKINSNFLAIIATLLFFGANTFWVIADKQVPIIGDDARFLQATYDLSIPIKQGNFGEFWSIWQNLFMKNTAGFPRTPLFALLSVPTFLVTGPNEDAAIITDLIVLAVNSLLVYKLAADIFDKEYGRKKAERIGLIALLVFNLVPAIYGFGRLYMSETLQIFFILLISWLLFKYQKDKRIWLYALIGFILGLAFLEKFVVFFYLAVQFIYYAVVQVKQKYGRTHYLKAAAIFLIPFILVSATWYYQNLLPYLTFARETSNGAIAEITSLGPVLSPVTVYRYWSVIALWDWGPAFLTVFVCTVAWLLYANRKQVFSKKTLTDPKIILFLIPLPSLLAFTLSVNKTARYFLPALAFWIILVAAMLLIAWQKKNSALKTLIVIFFVVNLYFFAATLLPLPKIPLSGYMPGTKHFENTTASQSRYQFVLDYYLKNNKPLAAKRIYNLNEETEFNDAELIWFFTQRNQPIATIGEVSLQHSIDEAKTKIDQADILIFETNPDVVTKYVDKYKQIRDSAALNINFAAIANRRFSNNSTFYILERINYLAQSAP
jgi:4-amino-4-deoxy-L-arabinose transferase-like glycosyltransferase